MTPLLPLLPARFRHIRGSANDSRAGSIESDVNKAIGDLMLSDQLRVEREGASDL